jgi:hypothetical protein
MLFASCVARLVLSFEGRNASRKRIGDSPDERRLVDIKETAHSDMVTEGAEKMSRDFFREAGTDCYVFLCTTRSIRSATFSVAWPTLSK